VFETTDLKEGERKRQTDREREIKRYRE